MRSPLSIAVSLIIIFGLYSFKIIKWDRENKIVYRVCSKGKKIYYSDTKKSLDKNDFRIKRNLEYGATTASSLNFRILSHSDSFKSEVYAVFIKNKSFIRRDLLSSPALPALMNHESGHFRITAIHSYRLQQKLDSFLQVLNFHRTSNVDFVISRCIRLYRGVEKERRIMQKLYDKETKHGVINCEQERWNEKISRLLEQVENNHKGKE